MEHRCSQASFAGFEQRQVVVASELVGLPFEPSFGRTLVPFVGVSEVQHLASDLFADLGQAFEPSVASLAPISVAGQTFVVEFAVDELAIIRVVAWLVQLRQPTVCFGFPFVPSSDRIGFHPLARNDSSKGSLLLACCRT